MKSKRIITIFIIFVFLTIVTVGFFSVFTIKRVDVSCSVSEYGKKQTEEICEKLDTIKGINLLFFNTDSVNLIVEEYPYFEIVSSSKSYPNAVSVNIKERRETYVVYQDNDFYVIDDNGIILNKNAKFADNLITLTGVILNNPEIGNKAVCNQDELTDLLNITYGMSEVLDSTDSIERIELVSMDDSNLSERWRVVFYMRTGVMISVHDAFDDGLQKIQKALSKFEDISDYKKCYGYIIANKVEGIVTATYSKEGI